MGGGVIIYHFTVKKIKMFYGFTNDKARKELL